MYAHEQDRGAIFLAVMGTATILACFLVILRLWVRIRIVRNIGADDWIMAASLVLVLASFSCMASSVHHGLGNHLDTLTQEQTSATLRMLWIGFCITPSAEALAKISISIMLMKITVSSNWKRFFMTLIVLMAIITIAIFFSVVFSCFPIQRLWDSTRDGYCHILWRTVLLYIQGVMAVAYDFILATSPVVLLWSVKISRYDKGLLCGLLALGGLTGAAGIARVVYSHVTTTPDDVTWNVLPFMTWKMVELVLSIIVGCFPTLRPLFNKKKIDQRLPYRRQKVVQAVTDWSENRIKKTVSIDVYESDIGPEKSPCEVHSMEQV